MPSKRARLVQDVVLEETTRDRQKREFDIRVSTDLPSIRASKLVVAYSMRLQLVCFIAIFFAVEDVN